MGISSDGILCYGFAVGGVDGEGVEWLADYEDDFYDLVNELSEIIPPHETFNQERWAADEAYAKQWKDYREALGAFENELGVTLVVHCHYEYPMYILAAKDSVKDAARGCPIELGQAVLAEDEWVEKLRAFCELIEIEFKEPQWILCSVYG